MSQPTSIPVIVTGAAGRMGRAVVRAVAEAADTHLVAAIDLAEVGRDAGELAGVGSLGVPITTDLSAALATSRAQVMVDFTIGAVAVGNIRAAIEAGVSPVVGATGMSAEDIESLQRLSVEKGVGGLIAPNFAIAAVLMMEFAAQAAKYLPDVEIIELHHEKKLDSPSGTALLTAQKIEAARQNAVVSVPGQTVEKIPGGRGAALGDTHIHSLRLPGHVAHQMVIFGGLGETLTLRHDSLDRSSFMPGVLLAVRRVGDLKELIVGLDKLIFDMK